MKPRLVTLEGDYPEICEWWRSHDFPWIPWHRLPKTGVIIENEFHKFCAGWLYFAEAGFAWTEWIVTNPNAPLMRRKPALEMLLQTLKNEALAKGAHSIHSSLENKNLIRLYETQGFEVVDRGMTNLIARISP